MLIDVRHSLIIEALQTSGSIKVSELSKTFQVTEKTIREDLEKLEVTGFLKRVHGGAILIEDMNANLPYSKRRVRQHNEKKQIAMAAYELIQENQILLLDGGSTTLELAKLLLHRSLTVITNDIRIAFTLEENHSIELIILGGHRRKGTSTIIGSSAADMLKELNIDIAFIGCSAIDLQRGLSIFHREESVVKKAMIAASKEIVLLADNNKFGQSALVSFAKIQVIHTLITDCLTNRSDLTSIADMGIRVIQTEKGPHPA
jgi:DeoR family fructose operon transcriptional repressor